MKKRMAVIAQTADPALGSEFATGWGMIKKVCSDSRLLDIVDIDLYISETNGNIERIKNTELFLKGGLHFKFIPIVMPTAHRYFGFFLRIYWQYIVAERIKEQKYDIFFQVSPNSIAYLSPLFLQPSMQTLILGPMRIEPKASVSAIYFKSFPVVLRQFRIFAKEFAERIIFSRRRDRIRKFCALHISPIKSHTRYKTQFHCRETVFPDYPAFARASPETKPTVLWSGVGDPLRKNEHIAREIVASCIRSPDMEGVNYLVVGSSLKWKIDSRIKFVEAIPRAEFLKVLTSKTIYLCTSLLEINSVLAEEVLIAGGIVISGKLPGFVERPDDSRVLIVEKYTCVSSWKESIKKAVRLSEDPTSADEWRVNVVDDLIDRIVSTIRGTISSSKTKNSNDSVIC